MITIFTPAYNRGYILPQLYKSLLNQSYTDFEWLIVDDGSTDDTKDIIEKYQSENKIKIRYYHQENQGKHIAHNLGVEKAMGELFFCVDSDDYLPDNSLEIIYEIYKKIEDQDDVCGIIGHRFYYNTNKVVGVQFLESDILMHYVDLYFKHKINGDKAIIFKTDVLKQYHFDKFDNEKFLTEAYLYLQIDKDYSFYITDNNLYYAEYLEDGLTSNFKKLARNYPLGFYHYYKLLSKDKRLSLKYKLIFKSFYFSYVLYIRKKVRFKEWLMFILLLPLTVYVYYLNFKK